MKTILVAGSKGGVGKTTVATHLAAHSALQGRRTVLADADPQGSATRWAERRAELDSAVLPLDASRRRAWRAWLPEDAEQVVIDAPAGALADTVDRRKMLLAAQGFQRGPHCHAQAGGPFAQLAVLTCRFWSFRVKLASSAFWISATSY